MRYQSRVNFSLYIDQFGNFPSLQQNNDCIHMCMPARAHTFTHNAPQSKTHHPKKSSKFAAQRKSLCLEAITVKSFVCTCSVQKELLDCSEVKKDLLSGLGLKFRYSLMKADKWKTSQRQERIRSEWCTHLYEHFLKQISLVLQS